MDYRYLGKSGLRVSTICLGSMNFGATPNSPRATRHSPTGWWRRATPPRPVTHGPDTRSRGAGPWWRREAA